MSVQAAVEQEVTAKERLSQGRRFAVVGTGHRAEKFVTPLATTHADAGRIVAWCEPNPVRSDYYDEVLASHRYAHPAPRRYHPDAFADMLAEERPDVVVVTSPDHTHAEFVIAALERGVDVIVEKPLTVHVEAARSIAAAAAASPAALRATFNYRYSPRNSIVRRLLDDGVVGSITSVTFEWLLDTFHGADYFRRWHRTKACSGGLLVHKASHHFDLVNWWLDDVPASVYARGALGFYGAENAALRGLGTRPARSTGAPSSATDPFALDLTGVPHLKRLYLDAEEHDGYVRDRDVFTEGIDIEDNLAVIVEYSGGAMLTYSLNAHSPWEGYRLAVNGTEGRLELEVVERGRVVPRTDVVDPSAVADNNGGPEIRPAGSRLVVQRHFEPAREVDVPVGVGSHGGGDALMLQDILGEPAEADPLHRKAGLTDALRSIAVGFAANRSIADGQAVDVAELGLPLGQVDTSGARK